MTMIKETFEHAEVIDIKSLNYVSRQIAEHIGVNETILLLTKAGGQKRYIPAMPTPNHALVQEFTLPIAQGLSQLWAGKTIELPKVDKFLQQVRNHRISTLKQSGVSNRELIIEFGITRRRIEQIMLEHKQEDNYKEVQNEFNF